VVKSVSHETTFLEDVSNPERLEQALESLSKKVATRLRRHGMQGRTVTLKLRYSDFTTITRQISLRDAIDDAALILSCSQRLFRSNWDETRRIRLIGVGLSSLSSVSEKAQLLLFD